jgi:hypothetical protein
LFARLDHHFGEGANHWRVCSRDGLVSLYGTPRPDGATDGWSDPAVVSDPADADHVFAWRLSRTEDTFGNRIEYLYEREPLREDGRHRWDQLYLSMVRYADYGDLADPSFLVTVSFVYEERPDPFSDYSAGFEIRTTRRCTRIDVATHADGNTPVRRYHLIYADQRDDLPVEAVPLNRVSLLSEIRLEGRDGNESEWIPPLQFGYTRFDTSRRDLAPVTGLELPPRSLAAPYDELVDLFGNGLPSVLALDGTARYCGNRGSATLDLPREMSDALAGLRLSDPGVQVVDADGDGRADLLVSQDSLSGYFPMRFGGLWDSRAS